MLFKRNVRNVAGWPQQLKAMLHGTISNDDTFHTF